MNLVPARLSALRLMLQGSFCFGAAMVLIIASGCGQTKVTSVHSESTPDARYKRIYVIIDNKDLPQDNREDIVRGMHTLFDPAFANGSITVKFQEAKQISEMSLHAESPIDTSDVTAFAPDAVLSIVAAQVFYNESDVIFTKISTLTNVNYLAELQDASTWQAVWKAEIRSANRGAGEGLGKHVADAIINQLDQDGVLALK